MSTATTTSHRRMANCLRCGRYREIWGRGLDRSCFVQESAKGNLDAWPLRNHKLADVAEDFLILQQRGMDLPAIADQLGYANVASMASGLVTCYRRGYLRKSQLPQGMWRARDRRRDEGGLEPHEVQLLQHYATSLAPQPCAVLNIQPGTVRTYKFRIRRKMGVASWDDAVKAFLAEAVLAA